jgi:polyhydroxyalkanoate synthesis regulator phasin
MIRGKLYKDLTTTLEGHSRFEDSDFKIIPKKVNNSSTSIVLTIEYSYDPKYRITFNIPNSESSDKDSWSTYYLFSGTVCPGPLAYEEKFQFKGEEKIHHKINVWMDNIWEEISANPLLRQMEEQQAQIEEIYSQFDDVKDDYFSKSESQELKKRLDDLEEKLKEQIKENTENKEEFDKKVQQLHTDIDTLKQTISSFKKKGWLKNFTGKVFKWTKDSENRKMIEDGYTLIKEFLPDEFKGGM